MSFSKPGILIWGASGHAEVVADIVRLRNECVVRGFLDDVNLNRKGERFCDASVLGGREALRELDPLENHVIIAVGDCKARLKLTAVAREAGWSLATAIHPAAIVARDVAIGAGSVVAAGAILNPGVRLGDSTIINTGALVDHGTSIGEGAHIGPGAMLAGNVDIGRAAWIGIGAIVIQQRSIGHGALIGAGAVVVKDIPADVVAYGVPARVVRRMSDPYE